MAIFKYSKTTYIKPILVKAICLILSLNATQALANLLINDEKAKEVKHFLISDNNARSGIKKIKKSILTSEVLAGEKYINTSTYIDSGDTDYFGNPIMIYPGDTDFDGNPIRAIINKDLSEKKSRYKVAQEKILSELKVNYINQIASRVKKNWRYHGAKDDWSCDVYILQDAAGNVQSVNLQYCNISNRAKIKSFKDAIERAIYKASPLPTAPDKSVFNREILFNFRVN
jgi:hypothetical protein